MAGSLNTLFLVVYLVVGYEPTCPYERPMDAFHKYNTIFSGRIESIETTKPDKNGNWWIFLNFGVCDVWKGKTSDIITVTISSTDHFDWAPFEIRKCYLVFASAFGGRVYLPHCSRTKPLRYAVFEKFHFPKPIYSTSSSKWSPISAGELALGFTSTETPNRAVHYLDFKTAKQDSAILDSVLVLVASGTVEGEKHRALGALSIVRGLYEYWSIHDESWLYGQDLLTAPEFPGSALPQYVCSDRSGEYLRTYRVPGPLGPSEEAEIAIQLLMIRHIVTTFRPAKGTTICVRLRIRGEATQATQTDLDTLVDMDMSFVRPAKYHRETGQRCHPYYSCEIENFLWFATHVARVSGTIMGRGLSTSAIWCDGEWCLVVESDNHYSDENFGAVLLAP